jgi:hypothetical protein
VRNAPVTLKTSTIFISIGEKTRVYRSVNDVPPKLRRKLTESTNGINSATILIADRNGREELMKAIQGRPSQLPTVNNEQAGKDTVDHIARKYWPQLIAVSILGVSMWLLSLWK